MKVFVSTVSEQFKACRNELATDLRAIGCEVIVQEDFQQHGRTLLGKLQKYIDECDRLIAVVGDAYGFECDETARPAGFARRSYAQWEYYFALGERLGGEPAPPKNIFVYFASPEFLKQHPVKQVADAAQLQRDFVEFIRTSGKDWSTFDSVDQLCRRVLRDGWQMEHRPDQRIAEVVPTQLFERVRIDRFVGRQWLLDMLDGFFRNHDRGYFVVEAPAGAGKTTFLAHLIKERGYVHHFSESATLRVESLKDSLRAQLTRRLSGSATESAIPTSYQDYFGFLLKEVATKRDRTTPGERIVIVIDDFDQLDESALRELGLPAQLPMHVYFILGQRPGRPAPPARPSYKYAKWKAEDEENVGDMREFLNAATKRGTLPNKILDSGSNEDQFVDHALGACRGNWTYMYYVLEEIESGRRQIADLETLPRSMWSYYVEALLPSWNEFQRILSVLGALQESIPLSLLLHLSEISEQKKAEAIEFVKRRLSPFLALDVSRDDPRVSVYHKSLTDFLSGRFDPRELSDADYTLKEDLAGTNRQAHSNIADRYLSAWGGINVGLPRLDPDTLELDGGYGKRNLALHLEYAERDDDLHQLLRVEGTEVQQPVWFTLHERSGNLDCFLADVSVARRSAERAYASKSEPKFIGLQFRYALITTTILGMNDRMPPEFIKTMVERGRWAPRWARIACLQVRDPIRRFEKLKYLLEATVDDSDTAEQILDDARSTAKMIVVPSQCVRSLVDLASNVHLPEAKRLEILDEASSLTHEIEGVEARDDLYSSICQQYLNSNALEAACGLVRHISDPWRRSRASLPIVFALADSCDYERAIELTKTLSIEGHQASGISHIATCNGVPENVLERLRDIATGIRNRLSRVRALAPLTAQLASPDAARALIQSAEGIDSVTNRVAAVAICCRHLPEFADRFSHQLEVAKKEPFRNRRIEIVAELIRRVPGGLVEQVFKLLSDPNHPLIRNRKERGDLLARLAPRLAAEGAVDEAIQAAESAQGAALKTAALVSATACLSQADHSNHKRIIQRALEFARRVWSRQERVASLINVVGQPSLSLALTLQKEALEETIELAREIGQDAGLAQALKTIAPALRSELSEKAVKSAMTIIHRPLTAEVLAALAPRLSDEWQDKALVVARTYADQRELSSAMATLVVQYAGIGNDQDTIRMLDSIPVGSIRQQAAIRTATRFLQTNRVRSAAALAQKIEDPWQRSEIQAATSIQLAEQDHADAATKLAAEIPKKSKRWETLAQLARTFATGGNEAAALRAIRLIDSSALAPRSPRWGAIGMLFDAFVHLRSNNGARATLRVLEREIWKLLLLSGAFILFGTVVLSFFMPAFVLEIAAVAVLVALAAENLFLCDVTDELDSKHQAIAHILDVPARNSFLLTTLKVTNIFRLIRMLLRATFQLLVSRRAKTNSVDRRDTKEAYGRPQSFRQQAESQLAAQAESMIERSEFGEALAIATKLEDADLRSAANRSD